MRAFITSSLASILFASAHAAQDALVDFQMQMEVQRLQLDRQRAESRAKLKEAIIDLRQARQKSCQFQNGADCVLTELSSAELLMLDIEEKFAESRSQNDLRRRNYKKIQEIADELRSKTNELAEAVDKADK